MSNITNINEKHVPAPEKDRKDHIPSIGDIYYDKDSWPGIIRITSVKKEKDYTLYGTERYNILNGEWKEGNNIAEESIKNYFRLLIGDLDELIGVARKAVAGDDSAIQEMLSRADDSPETLSLVQSRPADQVYALTEAGERLQDKITTIKDFMDMTISMMRSEMEARVSALDKKLDKVKAYVKNLQRIITVMNLYTGRNVDMAVVAEGAPAPPEAPIHVRQRILFMDEEFLADAENGGIDYSDIGRFCEWMKNPRNRDIVCPEEKCVVAMKPKRYNGNYSQDYFTNEILNRWNHHTIIFFRDGERILMIDSEDLELYYTAIPYTDLADRLEKKHLGKDKFGSDKSQMERLTRESESLGYMYTKYLSFLQGLVDSGQVFSLKAGRPNFAKEEGVKYVYDDENAIGTGYNWFEFQKEVNSHIRRGTRVLFYPGGNNEYGGKVSCGEPSRYYANNCITPAAPDAGVYNVDYPSKTEHTKNTETGRWESVATKGDKLAIFYTPKRYWRWDDEAKPRNEAWIYHPACVINYDMLTIEIIDKLMSDRTQRLSFRSWMPLLQQARNKLMEEKASEDAFVLAMTHEILNGQSNVKAAENEIEKTIRNAIAWWKNKVIFTRPLTKNDAKAWRMIKGRVKKLLTEGK